VTYTFCEFLPVSSLPCGNQPQNDGLNLLVVLKFYLARFKFVSSRKKIYICSGKAFWDRCLCVMVLLTYVSLRQCLVRSCERFRWENHFLIQSVNLSVSRPIVIRLRKSVTSLMPFYKWGFTACLPRKVWFVSNFVLATEWCKYVLKMFMILVMNFVWFYCTHRSANVGNLIIFEVVFFKCTKLIVFMCQILPSLCKSKVKCSRYRPGVAQRVGRGVEV